jgi:hypothetical protein
VDTLVDGLAEDVAALVTEVLTHTAHIDYGYRTAEGTEI